MNDEDVTVNPYENIVERLAAYADVHEVMGEYTEAKCFYAAAAYIRRLETIIGHLRPEHNRNLFICGVTSPDKDGMPGRIEVCPEYGTNVSYIYERVR